MSKYRFAGWPSSDVRYRARYSKSAQEREDAKEVLRKRAIKFKKFSPLRKRVSVGIVKIYNKMAKENQKY